MNEPRLLGLDLAWSPANPSGVAALDPKGRLLDVRADLRSDEAILAWVRTWLGPSGVIGIDMPTIVRNAAGMRSCERQAQAAFRSAHAGPYPANTGMAVFRDGGRAAHIVAALAADGVVEALDVRPDDPRNVALEVFPHAAHVRLFARDRIFKYKRKGRSFDMLDEWAAYRAALATLAAADPPLHLSAAIPKRVEARGYKRWDDTLDAITCAYVASFVHRWGCAGTTIFGDLDSGYIVVPKRRVWAGAAPGTSTR